MQAVNFTKVKVADKFWEPRITTNREVTLPIEYDLCKKTGRYDAWKWKPGKPGLPEPHIFWDSDVAKWLEAGAYSLANHPDTKLEKQIDTYVDMLEKGQMKDGYLNSHYALVEPENRWKNLRDKHELYCAGHLMEAAVAYYQATGKKKFLDIMCRYANHIDKIFGPQKGKKRGYPGHQEIELALVKMHQVTGDDRYLKLSEFFLTERGQERPSHYYNKEEKARGDEVKKTGSYVYTQAHIPVTEQKEAVGHSVRACYMYAGMADVAAKTGNKDLLQACQRIWKNMTEKRMYVIGGIGSERFHESFTVDYDLPNEQAYAETCAAIALVFFSHRMFHLEKDGHYIDVMERALYNGFLSGVSLNGKEFFYANRLAVLPNKIEDEYNSFPPFRQEWFGCSCCPPNVARLFASFGNYIYSESNDALWVNLYVAGSGKCEIKGQEITLKQKTAYPWKDKVEITISTAKAIFCSLNLRIPQWCRGARIKVNGKAIAVAKIHKKGYAKIKRQWKNGDKIELTLPMPVEVIEAHPDVRDDAGKVALQRGPLVYCLEEVDNGKNLDRIFLQENAKFAIQHKPNLLKGVTIIQTTALVRETADWTRQLYRPANPKFSKKKITAVPYYAWANRKLGEMIVWINQK